MKVPAFHQLTRRTTSVLYHSGRVSLGSSRLLACALTLTLASAVVLAQVLLDFCGGRHRFTYLPDESGAHQRRSFVFFARHFSTAPRRNQ